MVMVARGLPKSVPLLSILRTTSIPFVTFPKTVCFPFNQGVAAVQMKTVLDSCSYEKYEAEVVVTLESLFTYIVSHLYLVQHSPSIEFLDVWSYECETPAIASCQIL